MALQIDKESKNLLLVWVYYPAVGHYVEAIDVAAAYKNSNPNFNIFILLNNETTYKLTEFCGWINGCFIVDVKDVVLNNKNALCLNEIPKSWDYIIYPKRLKYTPSDFSSSLLECNKILQNILIAKESIEYHYENEKNNSLSFTKFSSYKMELPANVKEWALNYKQKSPIFTIMLEGSSGERIYPKIKWWKRAMLSLKREYPDACFILTGLTPKYSVYRKKIYDWQFINLANTVPDTYNFYDIGLEKQLALIEMSDVFISPHSGFAFLAPCLGTPWLCISGAYWSEQEFAHMPFYSVIPKCTHYPCINDTKLECKLRLSLKLNVKCMGNDLNNKIHDILNGTELLLRKNMDFDQSMLKYKNQLKLNKVNIQKVNLINEYDISIVK